VRLTSLRSIIRSRLTKKRGKIVGRTFFFFPQGRGVGKEGRIAAWTRRRALEQKRGQVDTVRKYSEEKATGRDLSMCIQREESSAISREEKAGVHARTRRADAAGESPSSYPGPPTPRESTSIDYRGKGALLDISTFLKGEEFDGKKRMRKLPGPESLLVHQRRGTSRNN